MSKKKKMGGFDSFDLSKANFTLDKPLEAFVSQQSTSASSNAVQGQELPGQRSTVAAAGPSCLSKKTETSESSELPGQRSTVAAAGPSFMSNKTETSESSWIREEDNCEENSSSFSGLDIYSPQLTHPTKARAKRPRTRRPAKNRPNTIGEQDTMKQSSGLEATGPSLGGKEPLGDTLKTSPQRPHTIRDSSKESTSASRTKDNVRNLRARFEQM
ncbi:uncharacterized protein LOC144658700 [Oculina patagonica]